MFVAAHEMLATLVRASAASTASSAPREGMAIAPVCGRASRPCDAVRHSGKALAVRLLDAFWRTRVQAALLRTTLKLRVRT